MEDVSIVKLLDEDGYKNYKVGCTFAKCTECNESYYIADEFMSKFKYCSSCGSRAKLKSGYYNTKSGKRETPIAEGDNSNIFQAIENSFRKSARNRCMADNSTFKI